MAQTGQVERRIAAVRRFNRFYTRQIGLLRKTYLDSPYSLGEMRLLYEIAQGTKTARDIGRALDLDAGYLSRTLRNFEKLGFISRKTSKADARLSELSLTARGRKAFAPFDKRSQDQVATMLAAISPEQQARLVAAMRQIESLLGDAPPAAKTYALRPPKPGDLGWVVSRHAELYAQEYGWTEPFESLCAQIVADFGNKYDAERERCWIAEMDDENVGCVMLVKDSEPDVARLRLLLVDPKARGLKLGTRLVDECVRFARRTGYRKITLWTHSVLVVARGIYKKAGFTLTASEKRHNWGQDVVAEFWDLAL